MKHEIPPLVAPEQKEEKLIKNPAAREPLWISIEENLPNVENEKRRNGLYDIIEDMKTKSLEYLSLSLRHSRHSMRARADFERYGKYVEELDRLREIKHNAVISDTEIIARNYAQEEIDTSWTTNFKKPDGGISHEKIGEWAWKIAIGELLSYKEAPRRDLILREHLPKNKDEFEDLQRDALDAATAMIEAHLKPDDAGAERDARLSVEHLKKYWPELKLSESEAADLTMQVASFNLYGH